MCSVIILRKNLSVWLQTIHNKASQNEDRNQPKA